MSNPQPHRIGSPKVRVQGTGTVINPGDPGYDEALARINARKAQEATAPRDLDDTREELVN